MADSFRWMPVFGLIVSILVAAPAVAEPEDVVFETEDGVLIHARYFAPLGEPRGGVVYLHQPGRTGGDWEYVAGKLAELGLAGVAPDLRGHGESLSTAGGDPIDRELFGPDDFYAMSLDVAAAVAYLRDERAMATGGLHLVGADVGASAALMYSVEDPEVASLAMLSPGLMYDHVDTVGSVAAYGQRPLLMVVSVEDGYAVKSADVLGREAKGVYHLEMYYGVGHGTKMLNREPGLEPLLTAWLMGTFQTADGVSLAERRALVMQDKGSANGLDELAAEERARAERDQQATEDGEQSQQAAEDADQDHRRWD